jgi:3-hydroxy-3-methylglutaryl CoA synthase/uncharacterized OB-fold protein
MRGVIAYGSYVPYFRLQRKRITESLGVPSGGGSRAVASYDEDTTSMGVEAARAALAAAPDGLSIDALYFSTAAPAYLDKTNATTIHAALGLSNHRLAVDMAGSVRSGVGALRAALHGPAATLVVCSDIRTGRPGGVDEREGGDAAVALLVGDVAQNVPVLATYLGSASASEEFLDRWRVPGEAASKVWEERFGEYAYVPLAEQAFVDALKATGLTADSVDKLIVAGTHSRAARRVAGSLGVRSEAVVDDVTPKIGNAGTAQPGLVLASVLDTAGADEVIALVVLADGCDVLLFRTTGALAGNRPQVTVADRIAAGNDSLPYPSFLTWRGFLDREPPRRPDPERPAGPPSLRHQGWKYAFNGSRCESCGTRHLPPQRVCVRCGAVDQMSTERLADVRATIATFTVDRLAFSLNPPVVAAVVDFDGGGRFQCELTDVDPSTVKIGDRVEMTFRRLFTADGVHNYFWKARPLQGEGA